MKQSICFLCFFLVFLVVSCKKKDACEVKSCQPNAVCNNGKCECENSYKIKDTCVPKDGNTFYYAGGATCNCIPDTFTLRITQDPKKATSGSYHYTSPYFNSSASTSINGLDYFKLPDGDSIRTIGIFDFIKKCDVKGKNCTTEVLGKFKGTDRLDLTVRFFELTDYSTTVDVCKITLKK